MEFVKLHSNRYHNENCSTHFSLNVGHIGERDNIFHSFVTRHDKALEEFGSKVVALVAEDFTKLADGDKSGDEGSIISSMDDSIKSKLSSANIEALEDNSVSTFTLPSRLAVDKRVTVNIFGNIKSTSRGDAELKADLQSIGIIHNDIINREVVDIDSLIGVSILYDRGGMVDPRNSQARLVIDINEIVLRRMTFFMENELVDDLEVLLECIRLTIFNKTISFMTIAHANNRCITNMFPKLGYVIGENSTDTTIECGIYPLMFLNILYLTNHNIVNNIDSEFNNRCITEILKYIDTTLKFSYSNGMKMVLETLKMKLIGKEDKFKYKRMPFILFENIQRGAIDTNNHMYTKHGTTFKRKVNAKVRKDAFYYYNRYEDMGFESSRLSLMDTSEAASKGILALESEKAMFAFLGTESANNSLIKDLKPHTRAQMLSKLLDKERKRFVAIESDIYRLKASVINCRSKDVQQSLLKRSYSISKLIMLEMKVSKNEDFKLLLGLLDNARTEIDSELCTRDFHKEKMTQLFGQVQTTKHFNF